MWCGQELGIVGTPRGGRCTSFHQDGRRGVNVNCGVISQNRRPLVIFPACAFHISRRVSILLGEARELMTIGDGLLKAVISAWLDVANGQSVAIGLGPGRSPTYRRAGRVSSTRPSVGRSPRHGWRRSGIATLRLPFAIAGFDSASCFGSCPGKLSSLGGANRWRPKCGEDAVSGSSSKVAVALTTTDGVERQGAVPSESGAALRCGTGQVASTRRRYTLRKLIPVGVFVHRG